MVKIVESSVTSMIVVGAEIAVDVAAAAPAAVAIAFAVASIRLSSQILFSSQNKGLIIAIVLIISNKYRFLVSNSILFAKKRFCYCNSLN
jgi:hypothetical protein